MGPVLDQRETRDRLLSAAGEVFADRGFHDATVREICQRAGANVAAVNYYFRDKAALYREVVLGLYREAQEQYPLHSGAAAEGLPDDRLRAFVMNFLKRMLDQGRPAWYGKLLAREMVEPTDVLDLLVDQFVRPNFSRLNALVREIVGSGPSDADVRRAAFSIVGQCTAYKHMNGMILRLAPDQTYAPEDLEVLGEHIWKFSLAGLKALRESHGAAEGRGGGGGGQAR